MKTIVASIDFSPISQQVVDVAVSLASPLSARVLLLHVVQPPAVTDPSLGVQLSADLVATSCEAAGKRLVDLQRELAGHGITVETKLMVGFPGQRIAEVATAADAAFIVLGSHGHGGFYELMVGSTTSRVLAQSVCPVVVIPPLVKRNGRA